MLQLPWEEDRLERFDPTDRRLADGRPRGDRWTGGRLDLLLPHWTASDFDPVESP